MRTAWNSTYTLLASLMALSLASSAYAQEGAQEDGQMALKDNESFLLPIDEPGNRQPTYPAAVLELQAVGARAICMRVDIDEEGAVSYTGPLVREPECPAITELSKQFVDASVEALSTWRFEPAIKCVFRSKRAKEAAGMSCQGGKEVPQPTSLTFRFLFDQVDGQGVVRMQR